MVLYHGGKKQYGNKIAEKILEFLPENSQFSVYFEPFCGMLGVFRHVLASNRFGAYVASDRHLSVMSMWQAVQQGWLPEENAETLLTQENADKLDKQPSPSPLKGYFGFAFFYGGQFFQGKFFPSASRHRKYIDEFKSLHTLMKERQVRFTSGDYREHIAGLSNTVIYFDPPYFGKACRYRDERKRWFPKIDHKEFWDLCRELAKTNIVFVSEQTFPFDFVSIASFTRTQNVHPLTPSSEFDHLIVHRDTLPRLKNISIKESENAV